MSEHAIRVDQLSKQYGPVMAVDNINFSVAPGELVGFLGPNGAGKSTTMRILTTFLPATSGVASVCGYDVMNESFQVRANIGYLPESVPLYTEMRVDEYLTYRAKLKGIERSTRRNRVESCLEKCRVREVRRRLLGTLSKGYRQRVGLADAVLADPKVLILDEPTSGLDPVQIRETLNTIKALAGTHTVLLSTHILSEVEAICDRVVIINRGQLRWDGQLSQLSKVGTNVVVLVVRGPLEAVKDWLSSQEHVKRVLASSDKEGTTHFEIEHDQQSDFSEVLAKGIIGKGWGLQRLVPQQKTLESLYMDVVLNRK